jgi:hypothetical protein
VINLGPQEKLRELDFMAEIIAYKLWPVVYGWSGCCVWVSGVGESGNTCVSGNLRIRGSLEG